MISAQSHIGKSCEEFHQNCWITEPSHGELGKQCFILTTKAIRAFNIFVEVLSFAVEYKLDFTMNSL